MNLWSETIKIAKVGIIKLFFSNDEKINTIVANINIPINFANGSETSTIILSLTKLFLNILVVYTF